MKHLTSILAAGAAMLLTACGGDSRSYTITGTLGSDVPGLEVVHLADLQGQIQTTDTLLADGSFTFSGNADSVTVARVMADRAHRAFVFLEPGNISVNLTERTATGTPLNDAFTAYIAATDSIEQADPAHADSIIIAITLELYNNHKNDAIGPIAFQNVAYELSADQLQEMLAEASDDIKNNPYYEQLLQLKAAEKATAPGTHYLDITGLDALTATQTDKSQEPAGTEVKLSQWADNGRPTLVDFWASWCGPCRREIPNIAAAAQQYAGRINVVGIAVWDQLIDTQRAMGELGITWPIIFSSQATEAYGIAGIPQIMLIGADGTILARDLRDEGIAKAIEAALK